MRIGALRYRITIERLTTADEEGVLTEPPDPGAVTSPDSGGAYASLPFQDAYGAQNNEWVTHATVWADYESVTGREYFSSAQVNAATTVKFHIRDLAGLDTSMRISYGGDLFNIIAILDSWKADILIVAEKVART